MSLFRQYYYVEIEGFPPSIFDDENDNTIGEKPSTK